MPANEVRSLRVGSVVRVSATRVTRLTITVGHGIGRHRHETLPQIISMSRTTDRYHCAKTGPVSAGWYPNPDGQGQRYFDGAEWTQDLRPSEESPPKQKMSLTKKLLLAGFLALLVLVLGLSTMEEMNRAAPGNVSIDVPRTASSQSV